MTEHIISSTETSTVLKWLGLNASLANQHGNSTYTYWVILQSGLKGNSIETFSKHSGLSQTELAQILNLSERTLQRKGASQPISFNTSDKLIELVRLFHKGMHVFNTKELFLAWLHHTSRAFSGEKPIKLIESSLGIELVNDELERIQHGIFA